MTPDRSQSKAPFLSVVIPAYNEESRLPLTIELIEQYLSTRKYSWELIVVDDGSKDRTVEVAKATFKSPNSRVVKNPQNMGKGASIRNGMINHARGRYRLFTDADNSSPIEEVASLLRRVKSGKYQIAIGSRAMPKSNIEVHQPFYREFIGRVFNRIVQALALPGIRDTQCGFKLFEGRAAERIFPLQTLDGFSFDVEVLFIARRLGYRIAEVPIRWINSPATRVSPIRDSFFMFLDVVRIRLKKYPR